MKPVIQSKLWTPDAPLLGNCLGACLASLLEVPLWMVPAFEDMNSCLQPERRAEWLQRLFGLRLIRSDGHNPESLPPFYIASGPSPRNAEIYHAVIYASGQLVHDPHPSGAGVASVARTWHLEKTEPA